MSRKIVDLTGQRFGKLIVIELNGRSNDNIYWLCQCDCGQIKSVFAGSLMKGTSKSCGCLKKELKTIHGYCKSKLYKKWESMKQRVNNPNNIRYKNYGSRGIRIYNEWQEFIPFRDWALESGYTDNLTLDRIDVNGNYCPTNCRWITNKEQQNNKTNNINIVYNNKTQTLKQWSEELGMRYSMLLWRIHNNWSIDKAFTTPTAKRK